MIFGAANDWSVYFKFWQNRSINHEKLQVGYKFSQKVQFFFKSKENYTTPKIFDFEFYWLEPEVTIKRPSNILSNQWSMGIKLHIKKLDFTHALMHEEYSTPIFICLFTSLNKTV